MAEPVTTDPAAARGAHVRPGSRLAHRLGLPFTTERQAVAVLLDRLQADALDHRQLLGALERAVLFPVLHREVHRPWGSYDSIDQDDGFQVKRIKVKPGARLSLQSHRHRAEHWIVVRGTARVTRDNDVFELHANQSTYIPLGAKHRLENPGTQMLEPIEVQSRTH